MSETWLVDSVHDSELEIPGFRLYRKDRNVDRGESVIVYLTKGLKRVRQHDLESDRIEILWIEVKSRKRNILIGNVYRPPSAEVQQIDNFDAMLDKVVQEKRQQYYWETLTAIC